MSGINKTILMDGKMNSKKQILIVFKCSSQGLFLKTVFQQVGCKVDLVLSGLEAIKMLNQPISYDMLITELLIDEISGFALCAIARKNSTTRIVAVNNGSHDHETIASELGVISVLIDSLSPYEYI